jgi:hypothetical protein
MRGIRTQVQFNTGTRVEQPKKGRAAYTRKKKHRKSDLPIDRPFDR